MRSTYRIIAAAGAAAALLQVPGRAQTDGATAPFHRGQVAADVSFENPFVGVGLTLFASPTAAWLLHVSGAHAIGAANGFGLGSSESIDLTRMSVAIGHRWYRHPAARVRPFVAAGVVGSYENEKREDSQYQYLQKVHFTTAEAFLSLGASVFVAHSISIGAECPLSFAYTWVTQEVQYSPVIKQHGWGVFLEGPRIFGTVYF